jgi:hypothetical protein
MYPIEEPLIDKVLNWAKDIAPKRRLTLPETGALA